jgi:hypothetical protein
LKAIETKYTNLVTLISVRDLRDADPVALISVALITMALISVRNLYGANLYT